jgi:hypothetical protein
MRYPYIAGKLAQAARAAGSPDGKLLDGLYRAHLALHTVLPEDFPPGPLRTAYGSIHDRLTKFSPEERHEESVIAVLRAMGREAAERLALDVVDLDRRLAAYLTEDGGAA